MKRWIFFIVLIVIHFELLAQVKQINLDLTNNQKIEINLTKTDISDYKFVYVQFDTTAGLIPIGVEVDNQRGWIRAVSEFRADNPGAGLEYKQAPDGILISLGNLKFNDTLKLICLPNTKNINNFSASFDVKGFLNEPPMPPDENSGTLLLIVNVNK